MIFSVDEMTGIQALERIAENLPMRPGKPLAREFEYKRNGTQTLIGAINVATGHVYGQCGDTRTEADFVATIKDLIETHPDLHSAHLGDDISVISRDPIVSQVTVR